VSSNDVLGETRDENNAVAARFEQAIAGDQRAIGRLLTIVERGGPDADRLALLAHPRAGHAHVVGITGAPGAGKSTLVGALIGYDTIACRRPAVLAVDPSSPVSGGAILGDRIRMDHPYTNATFIRSMATRGHPGGLARAVPGAIRVLDALGYDPVIVETVGVGQIELDIAATADTTVVVVTPGWGDAIQASKAGLLELADVFVVNKADRPGADQARHDLDMMLELSGTSGLVQAGAYRPPIVMTRATSSSTDDNGIGELAQAIAAHADYLRESGGLARRRSNRVRTEIRGRLEQRLASDAQQAMESSEGRAILADAGNGSLSPVDAAMRLYRRVVDRHHPAD